MNTSQEKTNRPQLHFMVVDDQPVARRVIIALLNILGHFKVSEVENGEIAWNLLRASSTDIPINFVITDWSMPIMEGLALLEKIRSSEDLRHLPVLMITAEADQNRITKAINAGVDGYIIKTNLNAANLDVIVSNILAKRRLK